MNIKMIFNHKGRDIEFFLANDDHTVVNSVHSVMYSEDEVNIEPKNNYLQYWSRVKIQIYVLLLSRK